MQHQFGPGRAGRCVDAHGLSIRPAPVSRVSADGRLKQHNAQWAMKVVHVSGRRRGREFIGTERIEYAGTIRMLITMTIEVLRERFVANDALIAEAFPTADAVAVAVKISEIGYEVMQRYEQAA